MSNRRLVRNVEYYKREVPVWFIWNMCSFKICPYLCSFDALLCLVFHPVEEIPILVGLFLQGPLIRQPHVLRRNLEKQQTNSRSLHLAYNADSNIVITITKSSEHMELTLRNLVYHRAQYERFITIALNRQLLL